MNGLARSRGSEETDMFAGKLVTKHTSANRRKFSQQPSAAVATSESGGGIDNFGFIGWNQIV